MEFILIVSEGIEKQASNFENALKNAARLCPIDGPLSSFHTVGSFFALGGAYEDHDKHIYAWDGHGVTGDHAFSSGAEFPLPYAHIDHYLDHIAGAEDISDMRGIFAVAKFNHDTGDFTIATDPLSQYPLFLYETDTVIAVSNNIYWLEAALKTLGITPKRDAYAGAMEALFGIGGGGQTGFGEIKTFAHCDMLEGCGTSWRLKPAGRPDYSKQYSYQQLLTLALERLKRYMRALDKISDDNLLFDLTGGQDSRICLAAAIGAGVENIKIFSGGDDEDTDKRIAYDIAAKFDLKIGNYPENYPETAVSHTALAKAAVFRQQGHSNLYHYDLGDRRLTGVARVRGGGGELLRYFRASPASNNIFWQKPIKHLRRLLSGDIIYRTIAVKYILGLGRLNAESAARWAYEFCIKSKKYQRLFNNEFLKGATKQVYADLLDADQYGPDKGTGIYLTDRSKRHFGYVSRAFNMTYGVFEPLYDPVLMAAAAKLSNRERENGKLAFDLIETLGGKRLLEIPFVAKSVSQNQLDYLAERLSVDRSMLAVMPNKLATLITAKIKTAHSRQLCDEPESDVAPKPEGLGMHGDYLWHNRGYFKKMAMTIPDEDGFWTIFKRSALLAAIEPGGYFFENEAAATRGLRIFHSLLWIARQEQAAGITAHA